MKRKNKKIIVISVIVGLILLGLFTIGYFLLKDLRQEKVLKAEVEKLSKIDVAEGRYNTDIKTTGNYAVVEETIKNYLDDYATTLQSFMKVINDEQISNILSAQNYKTDGPDFVKTKELITKTKTETNEKLTKLTNMTSEKEIMKQIESKNLDKNYVDLYKNLMLEGMAKEDFKKSQDELKTASEQLNNLLNTQEKVINLLVGAKGKWAVEGDKIVFQDTNTLNQYNELIKGLSQ